MTSEPAGSRADKIIAEVAPFMAHQRHKWAAQCQAHGLSMTHFHVLSILDSDGPTPMSRLAEQLDAGLSNVTGIVGRLEERGVVTRVHDATDRRMVLAQLTPAGVQMLREVEDTRLGHIRMLVDLLTPEEQETLLSALKTLARAHGRFHAAPHDDATEQLTSRDTKELLPA